MEYPNLSRTHFNFMFEISNKPLDLSSIDDLISNHMPIKLSKKVQKDIISCREFLNQKIRSSNEAIYGINTGFGSLCNKKISAYDLKELQENLVRSHACGTGNFVPNTVIKLILLLKIKALSFGNSGVQLKTVERLILFYNLNALPVVYTQGSLGASGDLAPLAHIALSVIGEGKIWYKKNIISTSKFLNEMGLEPISLEPKEGLALLNGTQFMSAYAVYNLLKCRRLSYFSDLIAALSLDAFNARMDPFNSLLHDLRPHKGQIETAKLITKFLKGSSLDSRRKADVQDPYSFRCIPQVHGATKDALDFVSNTVFIEINSVTDNPIIFHDKDSIVSGGNFHGQPLALALDLMKISIAELGSISERRIYKLISGSRNLPLFLTDEPGLNSGLMIPQYTAAGIVSENKQLSSPASIDSIMSSNGQEDHVSMGANAATQALQIIENVEQILAIELLNASQALFYRDDKTSEFLESFLKVYRKRVPKLEGDRILHDDIKESLDFIRSFEFDNDLFKKYNFNLS